jgi:hypothetical protein
MAMLGSSSPRDDRTSEAAATRAAPPAVAEKGLVGGLLRSTDWLVAVLPRPLRELLRRPLTSPLREQEDDEVSATILKVTVTVSAVAFVLLAITDLVDVLALHRRIRAFDADLDGGLWTWASVATEAAGAALLLLLAMTAVRWRAFAVCSLILAYFSLDDAVLIHEGIAGALDFFPHSSRIIWPLLYLPLLVGLTIQLWRIAEAQHGPQVRALVRGGLVALVVAVLLEGGSPLLFALGQGEGSIGYELEVALEEGLEMTGWIWITGGIAITLVQRLRNGQRT